MSSCTLFTGATGYILHDYLPPSCPDNDIYYVHNRSPESTRSNHFTYQSLDSLIFKLQCVAYKSIALVNFGSHLGGDDPSPYLNSVQNLKQLVSHLLTLNVPIYIYHASSFSIYSPNSSCSCLPFARTAYPDLRGPYGFSKLLQENYLRSVSSCNPSLSVTVNRIGHVHDSSFSLASRFLSHTFSYRNFVISLLYSPFKKLNPTHKHLIHSSITDFLSSLPSHSFYVCDLLDGPSPSLFSIFLRDKKIMLSLSPFVSLFFQFVLLFLPHNRYSSVMIKFLQFNNSVMR